jgi:predicted GNAT family acetyltransferase
MASKLRVFTERFQEANPEHRKLIDELCSTNSIPRQSITSDTKGYIAFDATEDEPIAFALYTYCDEITDLECLFVVPSFQGKGLDEHLLELCKKKPQESIPPFTPLPEKPSVLK